MNEIDDIKRRAGILNEVSPILMRAAELMKLYAEQGRDALVAQGVSPGIIDRIEELAREVESSRQQVQAGY